jgi:nucleoside phosphorylase
VIFHEMAGVACCVGAGKTKRPCVVLREASDYRSPDASADNRARDGVAVVAH